jgi:hypothetical protein
MSENDRLTIIEGMVETIDTLTLAGQRQKIIKIVGLLEQEVVRCARDTGELTIGSIAVLLRRLRSEAQRLMPDHQRFTHDAALLVAAIAATAAA